MIDYTCGIIDDQVVFNLQNCDLGNTDTYVSKDGFLSIIKVNGASNGWLGYGGMQIYLCDKCLPLTLETPHYEHLQDLLDVINRIHKNFEELESGNVLP